MKEIFIRNVLDVDVDGLRHRNRYIVRAMYDVEQPDGTFRLEQRIIEDLTLTWDEIEQEGGIAQVNKDSKSATTFEEREEANPPPSIEPREVTEMSGLKGLKELDYAVYGNVLVPLINFDVEDWFWINEDADAGLCRIECRRRKTNKIKIGGRDHGERGKHL